MTAVGPRLAGTLSGLGAASGAAAGEGSAAQQPVSQALYSIRLATSSPPGASLGLLAFCRSVVSVGFYWKGAEIDNLTQLGSLPGLHQQQWTS